MDVIIVVTHFFVVVPVRPVSLNPTLTVVVQAVAIPVHPGNILLMKAVLVTTVLDVAMANTE